VLSVVRVLLHVDVVVVRGGEGMEGGGGIVSYFFRLGRRRGLG
jgi:hypothetical protein